MLNSLGYCDDYKEVRRLNSACMFQGQPHYNLCNFTQFIFDNADFNIAILTGHDTFHAMGGIASVTPGEKLPAPILPRPRDIPHADEIGTFGQVPIRSYHKREQLGLQSVTIGPLEPPAPLPSCLTFAKSVDLLWLSSFATVQNLRPCPLWNGFMQMAVGGDGHKMSRIEILPFINQDPSDPNTIFSALCFAQRLSEQHNLGVCPVTFDQPLYIKAAEIVASSPDLSNICVRLGGFHMLMSYMGSIGYIMAGSGLEAMWETVYATNSLSHMLSGHAYSRALRAHILSSAAFTSLLLETPGIEAEIDHGELQSLCETVMSDSDASTHQYEKEHSIQNLSHLLDNLMSELSSQSRTGKLWINYLHAVTILQLFIYAERTGNWDLHLFCVSKMIPLFHAAGHFPYAKAARLYLEQMRNLEVIMSESEYERFALRGYFTIRRSDRYWSGNFSDQVIEQELMRLLKTSGGMTRGRGISDSSLMAWVHALPYNIPICDALEDFTGVHGKTSEQHKDLRSCNTSRDQSDYIIFQEWLRSHSPFAYCEHDAVVSVSTGIVADATVNCDCAFEIGSTAAVAICGKSFPDIKLSRKDCVTSISGAKNTISVRGQEVVVNPTLLFMRITCIINDSAEMEEHLKYELAKQPPSLFDKGTMRKSNKSILGSVLKSKVDVRNEAPENALYVLDGGHLLHSVVWPTDATYKDVCQAYVKHILKHYGPNTTVVFDGYQIASTKAAEQQRRATPSASSYIVFEYEMKTTTSQRSFLANSKNKSRLIEKLILELQNEGIQTDQHDADADPLIVSTALNLSQLDSSAVIVVGTDTDLLVMLLSLALPESNIYFLCHRNPLHLYSIGEIQQAHMDIKHHIMAVHALTGCDTVSAPFMHGKKKAMELLSATDNIEYLSTFTNPDSTHTQVASAGELFMLRLYGADRSQSLDNLRYIMYNRMIRKSSLSSGFKLEVLPPTCAAAKFHSYRAFHTIQQWMGNHLNPIEWGWQYRSGTLVPVETDKTVAPDRVLRLVSCGCKTGCKKACGCRKAGLHCSAMCSNCHGQTCQNVEIIH